MSARAHDPQAKLVMRMAGEAPSRRNRDGLHARKARGAKFNNVMGLWCHWGHLTLIRAKGIMLLRLARHILAKQSASACRTRATRGTWRKTCGTTNQTGNLGNWTNGAMRSTRGS